MSPLDTLLGLALLGLVLWNMRPHELTGRRLRRPLIIAGVLCVVFLHGVPTAGGDGALVALGALLGVGCGLVSALATPVGRDAAGAIVAAASPLAIAVTGTAFAARMAFAFAATHGLGPAIGRLSADLDIRSAQAWVAALVLMAAADLATRAAVLAQRRRAMATAGAATAPAFSA